MQTREETFAHEGQWMRDADSAEGGRPERIGRVKALATSGRRCVALCVAAVLLPFGCAVPVAGPPAAPPVEGYVVGAPDTLQIHILPEPEILRDARVRPDGKISIDLVGDIQAAGRTPFEIAEAIRQEISRFKRDATVNVAVVSSPSRSITIFGEVGAPGTFPLESEIRVAEALGMAGGTRPFASKNSVRVVRSNGINAEILEVRFADIQDGDLSSNIVIQKGDLIVVPPTMLARVGYAFQMLLFPLQPIISGATAVGGIASGANAIGN